MSVVLNGRVGEELKEWFEGYAAQRGVNVSALVATACESFREDCLTGVPEIRQRAREQAAVSGKGVVGVGECPESAVGHVWETHHGVRRCRFCELPGAAFLHGFGAARAEMFSGFKVPMTSGSGKPPGAAKVNRREQS